MAAVHGCPNVGMKPPPDVDVPLPAWEPAFNTDRQVIRLNSAYGIAFVRTPEEKIVVVGGSEGNMGRAELVAKAESLPREFRKAMETLRLLCLPSFSPHIHISGLDTADGIPPNVITVTSLGTMSIDTIKLTNIFPQTDRPKTTGRKITDLPQELILKICKQNDPCTNACFSLTCKKFFKITEGLYIYAASLYMRTEVGGKKRCLGSLLTNWMAPKYSFDHSWGKFFLTRATDDKEEIERKWLMKEKWKAIRTWTDMTGSTSAYETLRHGY